MDSSRGFGSTSGNSDALFRLAFAPAPASCVNLAAKDNSPAHYAIGTPSPAFPQALTACKHTVSGSLSLPVTGVLFTFPSRYWYTIGRLDVFSLGRWASLLPTSRPVARGTRGDSAVAASAPPTGLSPSLVGLSRPLRLPLAGHWRRVDASPPVPHNPHATPNPLCSVASVSAPPVSLATTPGISFDVSSSRY